METKLVSMETKSTSSKVAGLEEHLGYWMRRVSNDVSGSFARALEEWETSVAEWVLLRLMYEREESSPAELADAMGMTRGAVSKIVAKVQAKQWMSSSPDPEDARALRLRLTRKGQKVLPELAAIADSNDARFFACLNRNERTELRRLLVKLTDCNQIGGIATE
jgi:DNA-binding MarR family transcriptional regulator